MSKVHGPQLSAQIKRLRTERDWTQNDLALHSGVSRSTIARLETGHVVTTRSLRDICSALGSPAMVYPASA